MTKLKTSLIVIALAVLLFLTIARTTVTLFEDSSGFVTVGNTKTEFCLPFGICQD